MEMITTKINQIEVLESGNIASPKGYTAGGVHCGIRKTKLDFGWIHSNIPAVAAGVYTLNAFQAAPLKLTKSSIEKEKRIQTVVVNSGIANACTGNQGYLDALETQRLAADKMGIHKDYVAVASTGLIGKTLPMEKIKVGIAEIGEANNSSAENFEKAILTTDTVTKHIGVQVEVEGKTVTIGGAAKGSGMICPNMATMLAFITTDAAIEENALQQALKSMTDCSFNRITVDGDCSTNDMVLALANGQQGNTPLNEHHPDWSIFLEAFKFVCEALAKQIARDGEGATKLIEIHVEGAPTERAAGQVAKAVISSNLVKTAIFGSDPNWGRIVCAVGYSEQPLDPEKVNVSLGNINVVKNGVPLEFDEVKATSYLQNEEVQLFVDLQNGKEKALAWGCDLTYDYVKINASYRT